MPMRPLDFNIKYQLDWHLNAIGNALDADVVAFVSPILPELDRRLRDAIEAVAEKKRSVSVILDTPGGVVEVVERMVATLRSNYEDMTVIVPDRAMSAGTIFALSADRIMMDYFSCLGPIDPQIEKDGKLVPALSYLNQFERLNKKAQDGVLTAAEYALLSKLDLGELYQFEQARELSVELLVKWLSRYKFKGWDKTETRGVEVTKQKRKLASSLSYAWRDGYLAEVKQKRAQHIADLLNKTARWHSHARGIDVKTLRGEVGLKIDNLAEEPSLYRSIRTYFDLLKDYMDRQKLYSFVHTKEYF